MHMHMHMRMHMCMCTLQPLCPATPPLPFPRQAPPGHEAPLTGLVLLEMQLLDVS